MQKTCEDGSNNKTLVGNREIIDSHFDKKSDSSKNADDEDYGAKIYGSDYESSPSPKSNSSEDSFDIIQTSDIKGSDNNTTKASSSSLSKAFVTAGVAATGLMVGLKVIPAIGKAISAGVDGAHQHFMNSDPSDKDTWKLSSYVVPFISSAAGTGVVEVVKRIKGDKDDIDLELVIQNAENILRLAEEEKANGGGFSCDQVNTALSWIAEARKRLNEYIAKNSKGLNNIIPPTLLKSSPEKPKTVTKDKEVKDGEKASNDEKEKSSTEEVKEDKPLPVIDTGKPKVTIGTMLEIAKKATDARNPSKDILEKEDRELLTLIEALDALKEVPYKVQRISCEQVQKNIVKSPALGSRKFIETVQARAQIIVRNLWLLPKDRNKKLMIAASGPGTGKSTTVEQGMNEWACYPYRTITGSEFANITLPENTTPFEFFAMRIKKLMLEARYKNNVIYGDDFDRAWIDGGMFNGNQESRDKLFAFYKDVCDPTISTIFASEPKLFFYELAPGRFFPPDMTHWHFAISCNSLPPELIPESGKTAMIDRTINLNAEYADELDRMSIGLDFYQQQIYRTIKKFYNINKHEIEQDYENELNYEKASVIINSDKFGNLMEIITTMINTTFYVGIAESDTNKLLIFINNQEKTRNNLENIISKFGYTSQIYYVSPGEIEIRRIDKGVAIQSITKIVQADINMYAIKFGKKLGIRPLKDLLDIYSVYVESRLTRPNINPQLFSLGNFDIDKIMASIKGYDKQVDSGMSDIENTQALNLIIAKERSSINLLPEKHRPIINELFDKITNNKDLVAKQSMLNNTITKIKLIRNRITLPSPEIAGNKLMQTFGYFKANSSNSSDDTDDIDRFPQIFTVFEEIYLKLASFRKAVDRDNKLIRVKFTDPNASADSLYSAMASVFGNIPIRFTNDIEKLLETGDEYTISKDHASYNELISAAAKNGSTEGRIYLQAGGVALRTYVTYINGKIPGSLIPYCIMNGKYWVIKSSALATVLRFVGRTSITNYHSLNKNDYLEVDSDENMATKIAQTNKTGIHLLDKCFNKNCIEETSCGEAFIILKLSLNFQRQIEQWAENQNNGMISSSAIPLFEKYLYEKLNSDSWDIKDDLSIDPRTLTVFVIYERPIIDSSGHDFDQSKIAIDWLIGLPPIKGREYRARSTIENKIQEINSDLLHISNILPNNKVTELALNAEQNKVLDTLIKYDMDEAVRVKKEGFTLSPLPLDDAISDFINQIKGCSNSFGLNNDFPSIESFKRTWIGLYKNELDAFNRIKECRRFEEERRQREIEKQAELEAIRLEAQLRVEEKLAIRKAYMEGRERELNEQLEKSSKSDSKGNKSDSETTVITLSD